MSNKALWEVLDNIKIQNTDEMYEETFHEKIEAAMEGYEVEEWDHDDFAASEIAESTIEWIADMSKGKIVEDLQVGTWWTEDEDACFTVVVIKTKEA